MLGQRVWGSGGRRKLTGAGLCIATWLSGGGSVVRGQRSSLGRGWSGR
jgi:hypothetical protein